MYKLDSSQALKSISSTFLRSMCCKAPLKTRARLIKAFMETNHLLLDFLRRLIKAFMETNNLLLDFLRRQVYQMEIHAQGKKMIVAAEVYVENHLGEVSKELCQHRLVSVSLYRRLECLQLWYLAAILPCIYMLVVAIRNELKIYITNGLKVLATDSILLAICF